MGKTASRFSSDLDDCLTEEATLKEFGYLVSVASSYTQSTTTPPGLELDGAPYSTGSPLQPRCLPKIPSARICRVHWRSGKGQAPASPSSFSRLCARLHWGVGKSLEVALATSFGAPHRHVYGRGRPLGDCEPASSTTSVPKRVTLGWRGSDGPCRYGSLGEPDSVSTRNPSAIDALCANQKPRRSYAPAAHQDAETHHSLHITVATPHDILSSTDT